MIPSITYQYESPVVHILLLVKGEFDTGSLQRLGKLLIVTLVLGDSICYSTRRSACAMNGEHMWLLM